MSESPIIATRVDASYDKIERLLAESGELSESAIAKHLDLPLGNVRVLLMSKKRFGKNEVTGRWGLREEKKSAS